MKKYLLWFVLILSIAGAFDAGYLAYEHYQNSIPPCTVGIFADCGKVLFSKYAVVWGIPLAVIGLIHYLVETAVLMVVILKKTATSHRLAIILSTLGFVSSLYFIFIMLVVLRAWCVYCLVSAIISILIFAIVPNLFWKERKYLMVQTLRLIYHFFLKPMFFLLDPELVHERMTLNGSLLGKFSLARKLMHYLLYYTSPALTQDVLGINFDNPIGLAAGFDYEAQLTQILPHVGFGFGSVGTITNLPYQGNTRPMLGRLPKSKSLMVNKGFKNLGAKRTIQKLSKLHFEYPVGISIGRTNSLKLNTQTQSIKDIIYTFKFFESTKVEHKYYELNISCPNLHGEVTFYPPKNLDDLLLAVDRLKIERPIFVKMPIEKTDAETLEMLKVISRHKIAGVIFGNLTKNRLNPKLDPEEVAKFPVGNFSGKPCFDRSNELISLTYKHFSKRFIIIGCGGVFSAKDALEKIKRGATLIQLITGMIYEGPQLISQINQELTSLLHQSGFTHISQARGIYKN